MYHLSIASPSAYQLPHFFHHRHVKTLKSVDTFSSKIKEIKFEKVTQLVEQWKEIRTSFNANGCIILTPQLSDKITLLKTCRLFGEIQGHTRAARNGIVEIRSEALKRKGGHVVSNLAFTAHTDGGHLEGISHRKHKMYRIGPPKIIALQCIKPAQSGGENFLVDGRKILISLIKERSNLISLLFSRHCMHISREGNTVMNLPVFQKMSSGNFSMRFSYDQDLYMPKLTAEKLIDFNMHYVLNPQFANYISLSAKQIFIFDNHRYMHGRTEVDGKRLFRRIWIHDEDYSSELVNPGSIPYYGSISDSLSALRVYDDYAALEMPFDSPRVDKVNTGIALPIQSRKTLAKIFRKNLYHFP